jgi:tetratricopeptide (TPR) repeat protein
LETIYEEAVRRLILLGVLLITAAYGAWTLFRNHGEAAQRQRELAQSKREEPFTMTYQQATKAFYDGNVGVAEKLFADILPHAEKAYPNDSRLAALLSMLGTCYREDQKYDQAEPLLLRAVQIYQQISPRDVTGTINAEANLAGTYIAREDYTSAEQYLSDALALSDKAPPVLGYERGNLLLNLGSVRLEQGRYSEAEEFLNGSVQALRNNTSRWAQVDLGSAFNHLGTAYGREDRYPEARQQYLEALKIQEKLFGARSPEAGQAREILGEAYLAEGDLSKATSFLNQAQDILRDVSTPGNYSRVEILLDFGEVAEKEGNYTKAEELYTQAIRTAEETAGPEHSEVARALSHLGDLYRDQQQFDITKADPVLERALAINERALGAEHSSTASVYSDLSLLRFYERRPQEAKHFAEQALPIQEKIYGSESLPVSLTLNRLGLAQRDLQEFAQAEASLERALAIREKNLPPDHPWLATSLNNLASAYLVAGQPEKAEPLVKRAEAIRSHSPARLGEPTR